MRSHPETRPSRAESNLEDGMKQILRRLWANDEGQDIAEYALMLALILIVTAAVVAPLGETAKTIFTNANTQLSGGT